jgi:hypothetical protein
LVTISFKSCKEWASKGVQIPDAVTGGAGVVEGFGLSTGVGVNGSSRKCCVFMVASVVLVSVTEFRWVIADERSSVGVISINPCFDAWLLLQDERPIRMKDRMMIAIRSWSSKGNCTLYRIIIGKDKPIILHDYAHFSS